MGDGKWNMGKSRRALAMGPSRATQTDPDGSKGVDEMKRLMIAVVGVAAVMLIAGAAQADLVIDAFSDYMTPVVAPAIAEPYGEGWPGWSILYTSAGQTYVETGLSGVVGGTRKTILWANHEQAYSTATADMCAWDDDVFWCSNGSNSWNTVSLVYDGGGAGLNLNASAGTKFWSDMYFDHLGNGRSSILSMTVTDGLANTATVTRTWSTYYDPGDGFLPYEFLFSEFGGINFNEIDSITLSYYSGLSNDYGFGAIQSNIPEPATLALVALGGVGMLARRRRGK
jgi:hypothetical protein